MRDGIPNRATRRAMGYRGPAFTTMQGDTRPRYVRRNITQATEIVMSGQPLNRRQRKMTTRIGREAHRVGAYRED